MTNTWTNWAGDQLCHPSEFLRPTSRDEVAERVQLAARAGRTVRVAGAGHSFTDTVLTDGTLLSLDRMNRVLDIDTESGLVRVEAGMTLHELSPILHEHGRALPNLGDIDSQSVAGATATGTHGTGVRLQNLSAGLHSIELVLADGSIVEVNAGRDPEAWRSARVSVGALGVVTAVTLETVPAFVLEAIELPIPLEDVLRDIDSYVDGNDHFEFFSFPHSPIALTKRNNRTDSVERSRPPAVAWLNDRFVQNHALEAVCRLGRARPGLIPTINRTASRFAGRSHRIERSYRIFATPRLVRMAEMEYALPGENAVDAIREVKEIAERPEFDVSFPIEVRWVAPDDAYLSPAGGRETCYIAVHVFEGMPWEPYFRAIEKLFDSFGGRPHWGKRHFQTAETLRHRYPEWDRFAAVRDRLDPERVFTNDYARRVLG
ncbi:D-arabinono-1,4-lactone oxidase [Antrihabitans cavernicola]|uniref:FAD-binding protein n=1 Tax=Antrihabitans cavernicola TaxID=2495913 RepID=A0A5A7SE02_9NOCA|nr:D-arabinono-1,4-lactone oxidase [Spelaeibacter cavernicola]KAA0024086.1 FAD-binding protein [Spelaeibacter cavernicola]